MIAILSFLLLIIVSQTSPRQLHCNFSFDIKFGYTCRVTNNFTATHQYVNITEIVGDHQHEGDKFHRNVLDVYRVTFYNLNLNYLPASITSHFTNLRTLQVKQCGLRALTRSSDIFTLRRLYLGFNEIKNIPKTYFWNFCRLEILSLAYNQISSIHWMAFRDLINLKRLSFNGNRLKSIDERLFVKCVNMEVVDLDNNHLKSLQSDLFASLVRLKKLFMRNNQLTSIESQFLVAFPSILKVSLNNNPCINFTFPENGNLEKMKSIIDTYCIEPEETSTFAPRTTTTMRRKKPKYKTPDIIFFENCTWHIHKNFTKMYHW